MSEDPEKDTSWKSVIFWGLYSVAVFVVVVIISMTIMTIMGISLT